MRAPSYLTVCVTLSVGVTVSDSEVTNRLTTINQFSDGR